MLVSAVFAPEQGIHRELNLMGLAPKQLNNLVVLRARKCKLNGPFAARNLFS